MEVKADTTISALDTATPHPLPRLEPRNSKGTRTMVPVFHERLVKPMKIVVTMTLNAECPRTDEEVAGLLHAMQGMPSGPAKRGRLRISKIERLQ